MTEESLFELALNTPATERGAILDRECAGNPDLRQRVEALLRADAQPEDVLPAQPKLDKTETFASVRGGSERPGVVVAGKYKLLQQIGEGGMGSVWMADQTDPVKRRVAVKLIRVERGNSQTILARFEAERQAIALMDHPHIARLLDAGTTEDGSPFFVMELVKGVPLTEFCDAHQLTILERLQLFQQICSAVQHAHQKGIIHRDLKPTNILIESHDNKPVPKVIDFGLAKATSGMQLTEHTLFTAHGTVAGTPLYMAPEQAKFNAIDVDTRADIYSLGVILYELLTGTTPIERETFKKAAFDEMLRTIREQEPPTPSKRLSSADSKPSVAANRQTEPAKLGGFVRGELDWIVMKALAKERERRYDSATGFAKDIERFLNHEPVQAGPPSASYRLKKFVRRNRGQVIAASLVLFVLIVGIIGTTLGLLEARRQTELARTQEAEAKKQEGLARAEAAAKEQARAEEAVQRKRAVEFRDKALDALRATTGTDVENLIGGKQELGANEKAYLEAVAKRWQAFAQQEGTDEHARAIRAEGHFRVASLWQKLGRQEEARPESEQALAIREKLAAEFPAVPDYRRDLAGSHNNLGVLQAELGNRAEAEKQFRKALVIYEKLAADFAALPEYRRDLAKAHNNLGAMLKDLGKRAEAEMHFRQTLVIQEKLAVDFPAGPGYRRDLAGSYNNLGAMLVDLGKRAEAEEQHRLALVIQEKLAADFPAVPGIRRDLARSHSSMANLLVDLGKRAEAEEHFKQALVIQEKLAADFPAMPGYCSELALSRNNLGNLLVDLGRRAEALEQYNKALVIKVKLAADFPAVPGYRRELAGSHNSLGLLLAGLGKRDEAVEQFRKDLVIREKLAADFTTVPDIRSELAKVHHNLGAMLYLEEPAEAEEHYKQALAIEEKLAVDFPAVPGFRRALAGSHNNLGLLLAGLGKRAEAEEQYKKALVIQEMLTAAFPTVPDYRRELAMSHNNLGRLLAELGRRAEAEEQYKKALVIQEVLTADFSAVPDYTIDLGGIYCNYGNLVRNGGRANDCLGWYDKAIATLTPIHRDEPRDVKGKACLRNSHAGRALAYEQLQKYTDAIKDWDRAIELSPLAEQAQLRASRVMARLHAGQVVEAVAEVVELSEIPGVPAPILYNFACVYAVASGKIADKQQEYVDRAMESLQKAVQAGYKDAAQMKKDTDLDLLREREDFQKLLAELEQK